MSDSKEPEYRVIEVGDEITVPVNMSGRRVLAQGRVTEVTETDVEYDLGKFGKWRLPIQSV